MEYRKVILVIVSTIAFVFFSVGFSLSVTTSPHNPTEAQNQTVETTIYSLKMGTELPKSKDEQK